MMAHVSMSSVVDEEFAHPAEERLKWHLSEIAPLELRSSRLTLSIVAKFPLKYVHSSLLKCGTVASLCWSWCRVVSIYFGKGALRNTTSQELLTTVIQVRLKGLEFSQGLQSFYWNIRKRTKSWWQGKEYPKRRRDSRTRRFDRLKPSNKPSQGSSHQIR